MRQKIKFLATLGLGLGLLAGPAGAVETKITLTPSMIINESAAGNATLLVDEQSLSGDPVNVPPGGTPVTKFSAGSLYYPLNAIIDLGANYQLTRVCFYDSNGTGNVTISSGTPFNWTPLFTDGQTGYNTWKKYTVSVTTRYIQINMAGASALPNEILLYGTALGTPQPPPTPTVQVPPTVENFMGINVNSDEPLYRQQVVNIQRQYRGWKYGEGFNSTTYPGYPNNQNGFAPSWAGTNYDLIYNNIKTVGATIFPAIQQSCLWMVGNNASLIGNKPILLGSGRSALLPSSYIEHADHMFQTAARYGNTVVADSLLKLKSDNARLTGLNLIKYYEDGNEPDNWWNTRDTYFTPYEYAAMASADADGHLGAMGNTVGLKKADPTCKFVMAGIAMGTNLDYIKALKLWCDFNRGGNFPWDVINVHYYCNNGTPTTTATVGVSPEAAGFKGKMQAVREYRDQYLPGKEFWVSEFGYDTNVSSKQRAPAIGTFSAEEVQGQWLVRSYLALTAAGVDRAVAFTLRDGGTDGAVYNTSGLLKTFENYAPKIAWWYIYTLKNRLSGLRFEAEQASGNPNVMIYRFKDNAGAIKAYVLWCPTSNQTTVASYPLALQGSPGSAALVTLLSGDADGVRTSLPISAGQVTVNVSEQPIFVLVDNNQPDFVLSSKLALTTSMVVNESGLGDATMLVDEQTVAADPRQPGAGGAPTTLWNPGNVQASAYLDLGQVYDLDRIYLRDYNGAANLTVEIGSPGHWTTLFVDPMIGYLAWGEHVVSASTRYLRFTRTNAGSNFSEVVLYGKPNLADTAIFSQDFSSSSTVSSYVNATLTDDLFSNISAEVDGGTWSIDTGKLKLVRPGISSVNNGAGFTRLTGPLANAPTVLQFNFKLALSGVNTFNPLADLVVGDMTTVTDYNSYVANGLITNRLYVQGTGNGIFKFGLGTASSTNVSANGSDIAVSWFLNNSGSPTTYRGPDNVTYPLNPGCSALWANGALLLNNVARPSGTTGTKCGGFRFSTGTSQAVTFKLDDFTVYDSLPQ
jgi:hypothetical protein